MIQTNRLVILFIFFLFLDVTVIQAQENIQFPKLGMMKTSTAKEIKTSRWSIGGETLDRDYADYHAYKEYLGPLGAKRIRLQAGWAKCEQQKGIYDFEWLDKIIDDALSQGVQPWVQPSYGNPIYEGGGQAALAGGIPTSTEALKAWDNWVEALVFRYKNKVLEWEIWNEPDISKQMTAAEFAGFHVRTADIIKKVQPNARIIALGLAGLGRVEYVESILEILKSKGKLDQFDILSFHGYRPRPEDSYPEVANLKKLVSKYRDDIQLWQGENGAPSTKEGEAVGAMTRGYDWSELTQAKWNLRRMLGDMAHDVDVTNIFQISDMYYDAGDHMVGLNSKGLLKARPDNSIERPKLSYKAYQNTATLFSEKITRLKEAPVSHDVANLSVHAYAGERAKGHAITLWLSEAKPTDDYPAKNVGFTINDINLKSPVMVDLLTGNVYAIPKENFRKNKGSWTFSNIPVTDSPMVIVDKSWVVIE
ncbi:hypothetical protein, partial [Aquiflexum sp.]|uniref:GH39 family glycosyl hydrolase n=1 Tax=Aquiflexum sp. TaxID=1872584 RepID=UPI003594336B